MALPVCPGRHLFHLVLDQRRANAGHENLAATAGGRIHLVPASPAAGGRALWHGLVVLANRIGFALVVSGPGRPVSARPDCRHTDSVRPPAKILGKLLGSAPLSASQQRDCRAHEQNDRHRSSDKRRPVVNRPQT